MEPIHDFKLLWRLSDSNEPISDEVIRFGVGAPHRRLCNTDVNWWGEEWATPILCYRRQPIEGMPIFCGDRLVLQVRATHGFVVMVSSPSGMLNSFSVSIYYILDGFRGAEWGMLHGREEETPLAWTRRAILKQSAKLNVMVPDGPEPLRAYRIEDDRNLAFKVHRHGWYRMTLLETNPRSWLVSNWRYTPENSYAGHRRYFCIRKIWGKGYDGDSKVVHTSQAQEEISPRPDQEAAAFQADLGPKP